MAPVTLPQSPFHRKSGVLVLSGFGVKLRMQNGHLRAEWGVGMDRHSVQLSRVERNLKRIICLANDGFVTLDALQWLSDVGVSFVILDRRGKVRFVTTPTAPSDARLRRAQSLALGNGTALRISKELIRQKLEGQAALVREMLHNESAAEAIFRIKDVMVTAETIPTVRLAEAQAAKIYWQSWADVPIRWPHKDQSRVPEHWKRFGSRISPLTHSPRLAANPPNAILNLLYALLESESRIACSAMGLDPAIGLLHADTPTRDSLACDIMEVVRPKVDAFVLDWLLREPLRKPDFFEDTNGNCRLVTSLVTRLCETADVWRRLVAPVAEHVANELWNPVRVPALAKRRLLASRLTQAHRREVKGSEVPAVEIPKNRDHICVNCGSQVTRHDKTRCRKCGLRITLRNFRVGRSMAHSLESRARRAESQRKQRTLNREFDPATLPAWLTREFYITQIAPALGKVPKASIRKTLDVSEPHAARIWNGIIPHQRHWMKLAQMAGVSG